MKIDGFSPTAQISCRDSVRLVSLLRDGELGTQEHTLLREHVQGCVRCHAARQQFEGLYGALDQLLARPQAGAEPVQPSALSGSAFVPTSQQAQAVRPKASAAVFQRRHWLGVGAGAGLGALLTAGLGLVWGPLALNTVQLAQTQDEPHTMARRIAQYQALYTRATLDDAPSTPAQRQQVLRQWAAQVPQARHVRQPPSLTAQGLQLVRAQRLGQDQLHILQWVYLPQQGQPLALCAWPWSSAWGPEMGPETGTESAHALGLAGAVQPWSFEEAGMRGLSWQDRGLLWVVVAPQAQWSAPDLAALQQQLSQQLQALV